MPHRRGGPVMDSSLEQLPPSDPRGPRLRRWIPLLCLVGGIGLMGMIVKYVFEDSPRETTVKPTPATTSTKAMPRTFSELDAASKQPEVVSTPVSTENHTSPDPALLKRLHDLEQHIQALEAAQ